MKVRFATPALPCFPLLQLGSHSGARSGLTAHRQQELKVAHRGQQDWFHEGVAFKGQDRGDEEHNSTSLQMVATLSGWWLNKFNDNDGHTLVTHENTESRNEEVHFILKRGLMGKSKKVLWLNSVSYSIGMLELDQKVAIIVWTVHEAHPLGTLAWIGTITFTAHFCSLEGMFRATYRDGVTISRPHQVEKEVQQSYPPRQPDNKSRLPLMASREQGSMEEHTFMMPDFVILGANTNAILMPPPDLAIVVGIDGLWGAHKWTI
ncbi:hypothetical protein V8E53_013387 [Lactarius tabidus]